MQYADFRKIFKPPTIEEIQHWSLDDQCFYFDIPLDRSTFKGIRNVVFPEHDVLAYYIGQDWAGVYAEWRFIMTVFRLLCIDDPEQLREWSMDFVWLSPSAHFTPEQYMHHNRRIDAALLTFEISSPMDMIDRFFKAVQPNDCGRIGLDHAAGWRPSLFLEFYHALGKDLLREILHLIAEKGETRRFGWPDLTLIRDGQVKFVEVKHQKENLTLRQLELIRDVIKPCGLDVLVVEMQLPPEARG